MIDWLMQRLIQETPQEVSVCEFECPVTECSVANWEACELRHQDSLHANSAASFYNRKVQSEIPAVSLSELRGLYT